MEYKDIIDFLFNKKEDEELFDLKDAQRDKINDKTDEIYDEIVKYIDSKVHPKYRKKLKNLLLEYEHAECECLRKETELLYKNGFSEGIKIILYALSRN